MKDEYRKVKNAVLALISYVKVESSNYGLYEPEVLDGIFGVFGKLQYLRWDKDENGIKMQFVYTDCNIDLNAESNDDKWIKKELFEYTIFTIYFSEEEIKNIMPASKKIPRCSYPLRTLTITARRVHELLNAS